MDLLTFGNNLKCLRVRKGLTIEEMAIDNGFKRSTWGGYEKGKSYPKFQDFIKISEIFGVSEYDLLHTDLSNSDLIKKTESSKNSLKSDLNSDRNSDLNHKKEGKNNLLKEPESPYININDQINKMKQIIAAKDQTIKAQEGEIEALKDALSLAKTLLEDPNRSKRKAG